MEEDEARGRTCISWHLQSAADVGVQNRGWNKRKTGASLSLVLFLAVAFPPLIDSRTLGQRTLKLDTKAGAAAEVVFDKLLNLDQLDEGRPDNTLDSLHAGQAIQKSSSRKPRDDDDDSVDFDDAMSMDSFDTSASGQTSENWHNSMTSPKTTEPPTVTAPTATVATTDPVSTTDSDTTPGTCIICENILLISETALREYMQLFDVFEFTSGQQQITATRQLPDPTCGIVRGMSGPTARIDFRVSTANVTLNGSFPPVRLLQSRHDSAFVQGVGALRSSLNFVTGETSRQVQRVQGGPFLDFPPTQEVSNCSMLELC